MSRWSFVGFLAIAGAFLLVVVRLQVWSVGRQMRGEAPWDRRHSSRFARGFALGFIDTFAPLARPLTYGGVVALAVGLPLYLVVGGAAWAIVAFFGMVSAILGYAFKLYRKEAESFR